MITSCLFYIFISWQIVNKMVMVDNISTNNNIKSHQKCNKNTRKVDRNCISWVVIGIKIICTERSQDLIIALIKRMIQLAVMQPPLTRGHVLMEWPLLRNSHLFLEDMFKTDLFGGHVTKEQLKLVLMQPPLFRGHWTDNY